MAEYYLISQLPSLDGLSENSPLPISEERFYEICDNLLSEKAKKVFEGLTLKVPKCYEDTQSTLVNSWNESESGLRLALCKVRAEKMKKPYDIGSRAISWEYLKAAAFACEMENPMEAEKYLCAFRLGILEALRPTDSFSLDYIYYYGLKLKLLLRIRNFDTEKGKEAYRNIYNSILNGDCLEAKK